MLTSPNIYEDRDDTIWFYNPGETVLNYKDDTLESHSVSGRTESLKVRMAVLGFRAGQARIFMMGMFGLR